MKLKEIIENFKTLAAQVPNVGFVGCGDVYDLNSQGDITYPAIILTQQDHTIDVENSRTRFNFVLFWVERLTESDSNEVDNQSHGIDIFNSLIADMEELGIYVSTDYTYHPFTERFAQLCSGVYLNVTFVVDNDDCEWESIFAYLYECFKKQIDNKQDKLTAGDYISINGNRIDVTGLTYDDTEVRELISGNTSKIEELSGKTVTTDVLNDYYKKASGVSINNGEVLVQSNGVSIDTLPNRIVFASGTSFTALTSSDVAKLHNIDLSQYVTNDTYTAYTANTAVLIAEKASQDDLNAVSGQVSTNTSNIALKADKTDVTALTSRVTVTEASITQNTSDIAANKSNISNLVTSVDELGQDVQKNASDIADIQTTIGEINSVLESI